MDKQIFVTKLITETKTATEGDVEGVGRLRWVNEKLYRWVKNDESTATVAGEPVMHDSTNSTAFHNGVVQAATGVAADVAFFAGICMGAIPALGFGWILVSGVYEDAIVDEPGTTAIAIGESLIPSATLDYLGRDTALGTAPTYSRHAVALEVVATATAGTATTTTIDVLVKAY